MVQGLKNEARLRHTTKILNVCFLGFLIYGFLEKTLPVNVPGTWWAKFQSFWMFLRSTSSKDHKIWVLDGWWFVFLQGWLFSFSIFRSARPQFEEKPVKIPYWRLACGRFPGSSRVVGTIKAWVFPENRPKSRHRKTFDDFFGVLRSLWQLTWKREVFCFKLF